MGGGWVVAKLTKLRRWMVVAKPRRGGGGTAIYGLYRYAPL